MSPRVQNGHSSSGEHVIYLESMCNNKLNIYFLLVYLKHYSYIF